MFRTLIWKEWREQRWKTAGIFAVYAAMVLTAYLLSRRDGFVMAEGCVFAVCFLVPGFVAMGTITQERARRTEETMRVLPVENAPLFFSRVIGGIATMLAPLLAIQVICWLVHGGADLQMTLRVLFGETGLMVALYLWTLALGARLRSEVAIGLLSFGILLASALGTAIIDVLLDPHAQFERTADQSLHQLLPTGFSTLVQDFLPPEAKIGGPQIFRCAIIQCLELTAVAFLAYYRLNLPARAAKPRGSKSPTKELFTPRQRRLPILWKTWCEARLVVLGYLVLAGAFMACMAGVFWWHIREAIQNHASEPNGSTLEMLEFIIFFPGAAAFLVTIVAAVDIGMRDFENRLDGFWQSRPIGASSYMARRFWTGLLVLTPVLLLVPALAPLSVPFRWVAYSISPVVNAASVDWNPGAVFVWYGDRVAADAMAFANFYLPQALVIYGLSVLGATLTRRRVVSLVMGIGATMALQMLFGLTELQDMVKAIKQEPPATAVYAVVMLWLTFMLSCASAVSVKLDWRGWFERALVSRKSAVVPH